MRRIVISGASGFLGKHIVKSALQNGKTVVAITTKKESYQDEKIQTIDTGDFLEGRCKLTEDDMFINCLFPTNADGYKMADGLEKVYQMIRMAHKSGAGAFINVSSQSVYASRRVSPAKESDRLCLETPYAVGKYSSEVFVNQVFSDRPHTNIRMASLLGVGYDQRIVNRMIMQALNGDQLKVIGGMQRYGFLDVMDAAAGLVVLAISNPDSWKETYNLGRNESYSLIDVVECIVGQMKEQAGRDIHYTVSEGQDDRNSSVDASLFMQTFDWKPVLSLAETTAIIIKSKLGKAEN